MKCNPRNTHDVPSPTVDSSLFVKGHSLTSSPHVPSLLTVGLSPVTVKPCKSIEELQEDCVTSETDLNRLGTVVQNLTWGTGSCHPQLLLLQCPPLLPPGASLCLQGHFHRWGVTSPHSWPVWGLFLLSALLCLIHVTALSLPSCFSAPDVISCLLLLLASHGKHWIIACEKHAAKRKSFPFNKWHRGIGLGRG